MFRLCKFQLWLFIMTYRMLCDLKTKQLMWTVNGSIMLNSVQVSAYNRKVAAIQKSNGS